jgi:hypothetical protein
MSLFLQRVTALDEKLLGRLLWPHIWAVNEGAAHGNYRFAGYLGAEFLRLAKQALEGLVSRSCRLFGQSFCVLGNLEQLSSTHLRFLRRDKILR